MKLDTTLQNRLRTNKQTYDTFLKTTRFAKDLYNKVLYIQRQRFFGNKSILSLGDLFKQVKVLQEYKNLSSDLGQQIIKLVNKNFRSYLELLKMKNEGTYDRPVGPPEYYDHDGHALLIFISRAFKQEKYGLRLSLGIRGKRSTGTRYLYVASPPLGIEPKQVRIIPRYDGLYMDIEYVYELSPIKRDRPATPDSYLSIDLGLDNFATCTTTNETAFIIEGSGIKSFNRWWNKVKANYQSRLAKQGITGMTKKMVRLQIYRRNVINNFLNHAVRYIIDYCLEHRIETIVVGDWKDMKRSLKMRKNVSQLFQSIPFGWFKTKLEHKAKIHEINCVLVSEEFTSMDCFNCGLRRKANRTYRGLYQCIACGMELNADINGSLNIMKKVAPEQVMANLRWRSGQITCPSRIRLVEFV